jgi:hypothetical protein
MDSTGKILLIIVVVLVAVLSLMVGLATQTHVSNENVSVSNTNNTTSSQITQNTSTKSNQSNGIISSSEAVAIAKKWGASRGMEPDGYVSCLSGKGMYQGADGNPFYHVGLKWIDPSRTVQEYGDAGYIEIDAKTGKMVQR